MMTCNYQGLPQEHDGDHEHRDHHQRLLDGLLVGEHEELIVHSVDMTPIQFLVGLRFLEQHHPGKV